MRSFEGRLAWRDHFMQKLEDALRETDLYRNLQRRLAEVEAEQTADDTWKSVNFMPSLAIFVRYGVL